METKSNTFRIVLTALMMCLIMVAILLSLIHISTVCLMLGKEKAENLVETLQNKYPEMALEAAFIDKNDDMVQTDGMNIQLEDQEE